MSTQPLGNYTQVQLLGTTWIKQSIKDSHPVEVQHPSDIHPDFTPTRRTVL